MIGRLSQSTGTGGRTAYATALGGLWPGLSGTLTRLEALGGRRDAPLLDEETIGLLPTLQYSLHAASELVHGIDPPEGAESVHAELGSALAEARDSTAELVEAFEQGGTEAGERFVYEWRGTLFQVRLAWLRLSTTPEAHEAVAAADEGRRRSTAALGTVAALGGAIALAAGAGFALWPVWGLGLALVAVALFAQRQ